MVDVLFSSLFCRKATTTRAFKKMTARAAIIVTGITIEGNVVSFKSHVKFDACGQRITNLVLLEGMVVVSVSFMAILAQQQVFGLGMLCDTSYSAFGRSPLSLCHSSLYLNKGSSFEAFVILVKLSFTFEGQTPGKDERETQD